MTHSVRSGGGTLGMMNQSGGKGNCSAMTVGGKEELAYMKNVDQLKQI